MHTETPVVAGPVGQPATLPEPDFLLDGGRVRCYYGGTVAKLLALERERCAGIASNGCLVPPDGGSPTEAELTLCEEIARRIRGVESATFSRGDVVRKRSGSRWQGRVVGEYSTTLTPDGYAVESEAHAGSVQIYPAAALELVAG